MNLYDLMKDDDYDKIKERTVEIAKKLTLDDINWMMQCFANGFMRPGIVNIFLEHCQPNDRWREVTSNSQDSQGKVPESNS